MKNSRLSSFVRGTSRRPARATHRPSRQRGFTLIEVMIALIVLVLGVLGAAAMTLTALRDNKQASLRTQATALAYELGEMMRMNNDGGAPAVFLGGTPVASASCYTSGCALVDLASNDYAEWRAKLTAAGTGLPGGTAKVCRDKTNLYSMATCDGLPTSPIVVKLRWVEKNNADTQNANVNGLQMVTAQNVDQPSLVVTLRNY